VGKRSLSDGGLREAEAGTTEREYRTRWGQSETAQGWLEF